MSERVYIVYRAGTGRVLRWYRTDSTNPDAIPLAADELLQEMPIDLYRVTANAVGMVQAWLNTRTLLGPKDDDVVMVTDADGNPLRKVYLRDARDLAELRKTYGAGRVKSLRKALADRVSLGVPAKLPPEKGGI